MKKLVDVSAKIAGEFVLVSGLTACNTVPTRSVEELVGERAMAHMAALKAGDYDQALTFTTPGFQTSLGAKTYRSDYSAAPSWENVELKWVKCDTEDEVTTQCSVRTLVSVKVPRISGAIPVPLDSTWLNIDGEWYRYEGS